MGQGPGFFSDLREHAETVGIAAAAVTLMLGAYQVWVPAKVIEQNHNRVTALAHWVSRGSWLDLMQSGVAWVLKVMALLYGPPRNGSQKIIAEYLTVRAWKMSAWIAALLLVVAPAIIMPFAISIAEFRGGRHVPWGVFPIFLGMAVPLTIPFILTWRTTRRDDVFADHAGIEGFRTAGKAVLVEGTKVAIVPSVVIVLAILIGQFFSERSMALSVVVTIAIACVVVALFTSLLRTIRRHGFLAPPAFLGILIVVGIYCGQAVLLTIPVMGGFQLPDLSALFLLPCVILSGLCMAQVLREGESVNADTLARRFFGSMMIAIATSLFFGHFDLSSFSIQVSHAVVGIVFLVLAPYTLAIYAAIYANAIPDWFSVALTRSVLSRASMTRSLLDFALFLLWDLSCAVGLCILTAAILIFAFVLAGIMISAAAAFVPDLGEQPPALFFMGSLAVPRILFEWLTGASGGYTLSPEARAGGSLVLILAILSLTSLVPTALNALAILCLIIARCLALVLGPPFRGLHGLLAVDANTDPNERKMRLLRSAILIAVASTLLCVGIYALIWFGTHGLAARPSCSDLKAGTSCAVTGGRV